jgi:cytoskeletal protein RodZ
LRKQGPRDFGQSGNLCIAAGNGEQLDNYQFIFFREQKIKKIMIDEFCRKLVEKREKLGLTIENIVDRTKLHPTAIKDMETGNFANINKAYLKGFIKIYASFLGVELGTILEEINAVKPAEKEPRKNIRFKVQTPAIVTPKINNEINKPQLSPQHNSLPLFLVKFIMVAGLSFLLLWFLISLGKTISSKISKRKALLPAASVQPASKNKKPAKNVTKPAVTSKEASGISRVPFAQKIQEISVAVTAKRNCFLRVKVDGSVLFEGVLKKSNVETWNAGKEIEFKMSDGSAVYIEVNGTPLPALTSMRKPIKSLVINSSGVVVEK